MAENQMLADGTKLEDLIRKVRGVLAVRVVRNGQGQIDELHAVGSPERSAKQMVRDIESILYVRAGIRIDHRKISLVQIADTSMPASTVRVQLLEVAQSTDAQQPVVSVTLAVGDRHFHGSGRAWGDHNTQYELTAYAATHALNQLIAGHGELRLENLQCQSFGALQVYLAHLTLAIDDSIETLLGISVVRNDELAAVARAVLDAMNRRLQRLIGEGKTALHL